MASLLYFGLIALVIQLVHSVEELVSGFHKKWYFVKWPFSSFLLFEIIHNIFWILVFFTNIFPGKEWLIRFFLVLMFANGVQHVVWAGSEKKYVPGLVSAVLHIVNFGVFYFGLCEYSIY